MRLTRALFTGLLFILGFALFLERHRRLLLGFFFAFVALALVCHVECLLTSLLENERQDADRCGANYGRGRAIASITDLPRLPSGQTRQVRALGRKIPVRGARDRPDQAPASSPQFLSQSIVSISLDSSRGVSCCSIDGGRGTTARHPRDPLSDCPAAAFARGDLNLGTRIRSTERCSSVRRMEQVDEVSISDRDY